MMITRDDSHGSAGSIFCTEAFIIFVRCSVNSVASHSPRSQHPACDGILNPCGSPMTLALPAADAVQDTEWKWMQFAISASGLRFAHRVRTWMANWFESDGVWGNGAQVTQLCIHLQGAVSHGDKTTEPVTVCEDDHKAEECDGAGPIESSRRRNKVA